MRRFCDRARIRPWRLALAWLAWAAACTEEPLQQGSLDAIGADTRGTGADAAPDTATVDAKLTDAASDAKSDAANDTKTDEKTDSAGPDSAIDNGADGLLDTAPTDDADGIVDEFAADQDGPDSAGTDADAAGTVDAGAGDAPPNVKSVHSNACTAASDCLIPCASGNCVAGTCSYQPKGKGCVADLGGGKVGCFGPGDTSDDKPCLVCQPLVSSTALTTALWVNGLDGEPGLQFADTAGAGIGWGFSDKKSKSGGKSLWFGDPKTGNYAIGKAVGGTATLPETKVPQFSGTQPKVAFWLWLDTEEFDGHDVLTLGVLEGGATKVLWTSDAIKGTTGGAWQRIEAELVGYGGKTVALQFGFDSKDEVANTFSGPFLDDVAVLSGCCAGAADCDDGNACSDDSCAAGAGGLPLCSHAKKAGCCSTSGDCDDKVLCTFDLCSGPGGTCSHNAKPGCCLTDNGCDDGNALTIDKCVASKCLIIDTACKSDADCKTNDPCQKGSCQAGICAFQSTCCIADSECDDFNPCTIDGCDKGKCVTTASTVPGCCSPQPLFNQFGSSDEGWTSGPASPQNNDWHWKALPSAVSPPGALHFGLKDKDMGLTASQPQSKITTASPPITLLPGKEVTFKLWYMSDMTAASGNVRVFAVVDGKEVTFGYLSLNTSKKWTTFGPYDLSPAMGKTIQIKLEMTLTPVGSVTGTGLWVDDFEVNSTCQAKKCAASGTCGIGAMPCVAGVCTDGQCTYPNACCVTSADCADQNLCTSDVCVNTKCQFNPIAKCCMGSGDCADGNPCTQDICPAPGQICQWPPVPGCCLSSVECNDSNACTKDGCILNKCVNENTCCKVDKDCDDSETKCTVDKCVAQICTHTSTGAAGCCSPIVWENDFDQGDLKGIKVQNSAGAKGWNHWPNAQLSKSGKGVLYYGDPAVGNFDFSLSSGTAKTLAIQLPVSTPSHMTFWLYMDTEQGPPYDSLAVRVYVDGAQNPVWEKNQNGYTVLKWTEIKIDLAKWAGKSIEIEFYFNTVDSVGNSGKGVFVDDLKVVTACP
ncbi:MAG: hypothetical protein EXR79_02080 [Myxococcales bacterium]|nr:hypothetical protein [Myxococcales bacterium]